jgi:siroheme synthase-like protein
MAFGFPISLEVAGRPCVVFGTGDIARSRVEALLEAGAHVTVIARPHQDGDLAGVFLAVAAAGDPADNARIFAEAERERVLLNAVDDPTRCHFAMPSILRRGDLRIAVSTGGRAPGYARRLREELESVIGPEYAELVQRMGDARDRRLAATAEEQKEAVA